MNRELLQQALEALSQYRSTVTRGYTKVDQAIDALRNALAQPVQQTLRKELQRQCSAWDVYWREADAHGVVLTSAQAVELLESALGVEVELTDAQTD